MAEKTTISGPVLLTGSLTDPVTTFQHQIETQRSAAIRHEELLTFQMNTLNTDLVATRVLIASCDAALAAMANPPRVIDQTANQQEQGQSQQQESEQLPSHEPPNRQEQEPIPPFLTEPKT